MFNKMKNLFFSVHKCDKKCMLGLQRAASTPRCPLKPPWLLASARAVWEVDQHCSTSSLMAQQSALWRSIGAPLCIPKPAKMGWAWWDFKELVTRAEAAMLAGRLWGSGKECSIEPPTVPPMAPLAPGKCNNVFYPPSPHLPTFGTLSQIKKVLGPWA